MNDIENYLPQRPPIVMIDRLVEAGNDCTVTDFTVREGHLFVENGTLTEPGLIENMAQTAAAGMGCQPTVAGQEPKVGFIGALKNLKIIELPPIGATIITTIKQVHRVMNAQIVLGSVRLGMKEIAQCELKIFLQ